ncbi:XrtA/PEP-CTERM system histidine kinase PrsK [Candidatus Nitrospira bockiana]
MPESMLQIAPSFIGLAACLGLAFLIAARTRRRPLHWALAVALVALAVVQLGNGMSLLAQSGEGLLGWRRVALAGEILLPVGWLFFSLAFARANADEVLRDWRPVLGGMSAAAAVFLALVGSEAMLRIVSPDGAYVGLGPAGRVFGSLYLVAQVLILANLEQTLRHADEQSRWYIKFPVVGLGLVSMFFLYETSDLLLYSVWHAELAWMGGMVTTVACGLIGYGLLHRPIPDVQIYISKNVISGSLTFLLVGGVLAGTGAIAWFIKGSGLPGSMLLSALFVLLAITGLVFVLLSAHVRHTVGRFAERHFFPHTYDYRARWLEVTDAISAPGSPEQIGWRAMQLFKGIFGARTVAVWAAFDGGSPGWVRLAAHQARETPGRLKDLGEIRAWLETHLEPSGVSIGDGVLPPGLEAELVAAEAAVLVPLRAGPRAVGWVSLGARADGSLYSHQDRDLMRCIAGQVADRLQHLILADRLIMAREMEGFYECSTFFLHDLKNFIATLSLVIQNAERHGGNPEFQRAAMATIGSTVRRMTTLMGTIAALSRDVRPKMTVVDVNALVDDVLKDFEKAAGATLIRQAAPVPLVEADPDQLRQVVLNLLLNAQDAVGTEGRIVLKTETDGGAAQLVVEDNGCGMDAATVGGLFRPFRSTKGRGLGIGLYQCRKILETHGGTLDVDSEPGRGTRFVVRLNGSRAAEGERHDEAGIVDRR